MVKANTDSEAIEAPTAAQQPPPKIFSKSGNFSGFLFCTLPSLSPVRLCIQSPCLRNQPSDLLPKENQITLTAMANHSRYGRIEQQHLRSFSTSRTCGRLFLSHGRYCDAPMIDKHEGSFSKRDQLLVAVRTHHTSSRGIEHEDYA